MSDVSRAFSPSHMVYIYTPSEVRSHQGRLDTVSVSALSCYDRRMLGRAVCGDSSWQPIMQTVSRRILYDGALRSSQLTRSEHAVYEDDRGAEVVVCGASALLKQFHRMSRRVLR